MLTKSLTLFASLSTLLTQVSAQCLNQNTANGVANNYAQLFINYSNTLANQVLSPTFTDQSDSVISLINNGTTCPDALGSLTFNSRQAFETASASQPDIPFQILETYYNCNTVFTRWVSKQTPEQVQGISFLKTTPNFNPATFYKTPFLITSVEAEFNSLAWTVNLGFYKGTPPAGCPA